MRPKLHKIDEKLIPLRRLAVNGLYNAPYLSLLVQRNKLKAQKIGRNFYTTSAWFKEYLDLHSRDGKREDYYRFLETLDQDLNTSKQTKKVIKKLASNQQKQIIGERQEASFFVVSRAMTAKRLISSIFIGVGIIAVIYIVSSISISRHFENQGQVAGVEEEVGSSTTEVININTNR
ncbi:hypothetical protein ACFLZ9_00165 [Patescibacteria group bacterium]